MKFCGVTAINASWDCLNGPQDNNTITIIPEVCRLNTNPKASKANGIAIEEKF